MQWLILKSGPTNLFELIIEGDMHLSMLPFSVFTITVVSIDASLLLLNYVYTLVNDSPLLW